VPRPRKRFAQHFLTDGATLDRIVEGLALVPGTTVVEIGPGRGALTDRLARAAGRVIAVEIDRDLVALLRDRYAGLPGVDVVEGDALEVPWDVLSGGPYVLAGNLPYYITTPLIFRVLVPPRPDRAVLLVQREVADRLVATAGSAAYGALTVNVGVHATVELLRQVPAGAFHPRPSVDSAVVRLVPREEPLLAPDEERPFRAFVTGLFGFRRKQLVRALRELTGIGAEVAREVLVRAGVEPSARVETLAPGVILGLFRVVRATGWQG
jgi:16S rRNA (adenine1518-N6/adenine1519-N6)-dimethyltransferase